MAERDKLLAAEMSRLTGHLAQLAKEANLIDGEAEKLFEYKFISEDAVAEIHAAMEILGGLIDPLIKRVKGEIPPAEPGCLLFDPSRFEG